MARALAVELIGDSRSLERAFKRSSQSAHRFNQDIGRVSRGGAAASGLFMGLGRSVAFASAGFLGGFGLVTALRAAFGEMNEMQKVSAQTSTAIRSTGGVAAVSAKHVEELGLSLMNLSGVNDEAIKSSENLLLTFTNIRNVAGKGNDVFDQATRSALDLSVRFGKDLSQSAVLVGKALQDPVRGLTSLQRVGVQFTSSQRKTIKALVESGRTLEAQKIILRELQVETGGAARAYGETLAGKLNIAKENVLNMAGAIASALLPQLTASADQLDRWLKNPQNQKKIVDGLSGALRDLGKAFSFVGQWAAWAGGKVNQTHGFLLDMKADALTTARKFTEPLSHIPGTGFGGIPEAARKEKEKLTQQIADLRAKSARLRNGPGPVAGQAASDAGGRGRITAADIVIPEAGADAPGQDTTRAAARARGRRAREALRQLQLDRAAFAVDRAATTKSLTDDLSALGKLQSLLRRRIRGGHSTLELQRQLLGVQQQIADVVKQQAEARAKARDDRQFRRLGFGPGGEDLVPGVKGLKKQLDAVRGAISGSFLDTRKTRGLLAHIRQVLSGGLGAVGKEVRQKIQEILADLKNQLKQSSVDVTKFQKVAPGILGALGLNAKQRRALSRILPQLGPGGTVPTGSGQFSGAGAVHVNVQIDGKTVAKATARHNENEAARRRKQRAHARRGTR